MTGRTIVESAVRPDGTDLATGRIDVFSRRKNLSVIDYHCGNFRVERSAVLESFRETVAGADGATVEASCKFSDSRCHAARFNLFFHRPDRAAYRAVCDHLETSARAMRGTLDMAPIDAFVGSGFDIARLMKLVTGLDLRSSPQDSRFKIWFMLDGYSDRIERAIAMCDDELSASACRQFRVHDEFLVGFDLHLDGRCRVKLYPDVRPEELADARLRGCFSSRAYEAMGQCRRVHIYLTSGAPRVLQFHPRDPDDFLNRYVDPERARRIHPAYRGSRLLDMVVSCGETALQDLPVREFALYYMPAESPVL